MVLMKTEGFFNEKVNTFFHYFAFLDIMSPFYAYVKSVISDFIGK